MTSSFISTNTRTSPLLDGLGTFTKTPLAYVSLPDPVDNNCEVRNYKVLGSYNWLDSRIPMILIPGYPRIWREPSFPLQLSPDQGYIFVDQNAWRCKESPLEPLFRSVLVTQQLSGNTSFSLADQQIDVVADRNNLCKLSTMVRSMKSNETLIPSKNREFRIDAQLAPNGRTLLLTRYSPQSQLMTNPGDTGYGNNFEQATTSKYAPILAYDKRQSRHEKLFPTSYHRIARYSLANLNLLVRYEVDAVQSAPPNDNISIPGEPSFGGEVETLPHSTLHHVVSGALIPQDRIIEIKTGKLKWAQICSQLYFSQTPILKVGVHRSGNFSKTADHTTDESYISRAVESNQELVDNLRFFVPLLNQMKHACEQHSSSGEPLAFFWSGAGPLQLYVIDHPARSYNLPKDILESL